MRAAARIVWLQAWLGLALCAEARAQPSATLDQYRPTATSADGFAARSATAPPHLALELQLALDYANDPLVYEQRRGQAGSEKTALVAHQLAAHALVALGLLDALLVRAALPLQLVMDGSALGSQPTATGAGAGDLGLGARGVFLALPKVSLALSLDATFPTGEGGDLRPGVAGDAGATLHPALLAQVSVASLRLLFDAGLRMRKEASFSGATFDDELTYALGLALPLSRDELDLHAEVFGATPAADVGLRAASPLEALLGLRARVGTQLRFGLGGGAGLLRGYGAPDLRVVATAAWSSVRARHAVESSPQPKSKQAPEQPVEPARPPPAPELAAAPALPPAPDTDGDGTSDDADSCRLWPGAADRGGCGEAVGLHETSFALTLEPAVTWKRRTATLEAQSVAALEEVARALSRRPDYAVLVLEHAAPGGDPEEAIRGTLDRASALASFLTERGVAAGAVDAYGCGAARPIAPAHGKDKGKNERTELFLVKPAPASGAPATTGCLRAPRQQGRLYREPTPSVGSRQPGVQRP